MSRSSTTTSKAGLLSNPHPGEILLEEFLKPMRRRDAVQASQALPACALQLFVRWRRDPLGVDAAELIADDTPAEAVFQFRVSLADHLKEQVGERECATTDFFSGSQEFPDGQGRVEWAIGWPLWG